VSGEGGSRLSENEIVDPRLNPWAVGSQYWSAAESLSFSLLRLIAFYVEAHNEVMPHSAFEGHTPNEVFFGTGDAVVAKLAAERVQAQAERMARNRSAGCGVCIGRAG